LIRRTTALSDSLSPVTRPALVTTQWVFGAQTGGRGPVGVRDGAAMGEPGIEGGGRAEAEAGLGGVGPNGGLPPGRAVGAPGAIATSAGSVMAARAVPSGEGRGLGPGPASFRGALFGPVGAGSCVSVGSGLSGLAMGVILERLFSVRKGLLSDGTLWLASRASVSPPGRVPKTHQVANRSS
jgi:hypothetical protein